MRELIDDAATYFDAIQIIMQIEDDQGIEIPDSVVEEIRPWEQLTINDLIAATNRCVSSSGIVNSAERAVAAAIRTQFPSSPASLDFDVPLLEAISSGREDGSSYA